MASRLVLVLKLSELSDLVVQELVLSTHRLYILLDARFHAGYIECTISRTLNIRSIFDCNDSNLDRFIQNIPLFIQFSPFCCFELGSEFFYENVTFVQ